MRFIRNHCTHRILFARLQRDRVTTMHVSLPTRREIVFARETSPSRHEADSNVEKCGAMDQKEVEFVGMCMRAHVWASNNFISKGMSTWGFTRYACSWLLCNIWQLQLDKQIFVLIHTLQFYYFYFIYFIQKISFLEECQHGDLPNLLLFQYVTIHSIGYSMYSLETRNCGPHADTHTHVSTGTHSHTLM